VVTVVYNGEAFLEQTIQSVLHQSYKSLEYIVIDGASTDGSLDIVRRYSDSIEYWVSEPDSGIAEAMNKGIRVARGDYVLFIHADDYLLNEQAIEMALSTMSATCTIAAFAILFQQRDVTTTWVPRGFNVWLNFKTVLPHQGVLCARRLFEELGLFDTHFRIAMDYEFWLRAYRHGVIPETHALPITVMRATGVSSRLDWPSLARRFDEERRAQRKHLSASLMKPVYAVYWFVYLRYRFLRCRLIAR
jgi:glycosyltransferase involved in cell wall biosynthesis